MIDEMTQARTEICVVVDEHGGTAGIATLSDVMEQIVGKMDDEYRHVSDASVKCEADGTFNIDGKMPIADLVEIMGFEPEEAADVETAAGVVLKLMDKIPREGEEVSVEKRSAEEVITATFEVDRMERLRIDRIVLTIDRAGI